MAVAAIRPDDVNFPLLLHVLGATMLVGTLFAASLALVLAWGRSGDAAAFTRFGFWSILGGVLHGYVVMRVAAEWTASEEFGGSDPDLAWLDIGYITADLGALIILLAIVLTVIGLRRTRRERRGGATLARIVGPAAVLLLLAYLVAVWAMTVKPT